ncbi:MAG: hypothetical protein FWC26_01105 [Fibromonadales bacterium]|nr:hypothetical protein [Fibromonadales bacterium]
MYFLITKKSQNPLLSYSFVIVQPFACLDNHISGRGLTKAVKSKYPHIQVLSLDYDPDTSFANIENRLQMLIINAKLAYTRLELS